MPMSLSDAAALTQSGIDALRRGDAAAARSLFDRVRAAGAADATTFLGLAYACTALRDPAASLAAVEAALQLEPRNLRALMHKADHLGAAGNMRSAVSFYQAALRAVPPEAELPPELQKELTRAQAACDGYAQQFETYLGERLAAAGGEPSVRFAQSLDILRGNKQIYVQQPKLYYFPELPQIQFYQRSQFAWIDDLEAASADIRAELLAVMPDKSAFKPYVQAEAGRANLVTGGMLNNPDWSAFYLLKDGEPVAANAARCPRTIEALGEIPVARIPGCSPSVLFSVLRPGARIPPHHGYTNTRLICHLPLIAPPGCGFRVGNETRTWEEGKAWLFDDTIEHEAWNNSDQTRVILLFEIWRPELSLAERASVAAMFEAVAQHGGGAEMGI
jgi:aspartate beta-hydroxylase